MSRGTSAVAELLVLDVLAKLSILQYRFVTFWLNYSKDKNSAVNGTVIELIIIVFIRTYFFGLSWLIFV